MPSSGTKPTTELEQVFRANRRKFVQGIQAYAFAIASKQQTDVVRDDLRTLYWQSFALADMMGRRRLLLEADAHRGSVTRDLERRVIFADEPLTVPEIPFREAIDDIARREPRLAKTADQVADIYRRKAGFAAVQSTELRLTKKIKEVFVDLERRGTTTIEARQVIEEMTGWTQSYSHTVYRTNLNTAYTAGRMEQVKDPAVASVIGAFELSAIPDIAVRRGRDPQDVSEKGKSPENHLAGNGLIAGTHDPIWKDVAPPHGYSCRCSIMLVDRFRLESKGLIEANGRVKQYHPKGMAFFRSNFRAHSRFGNVPSADGRPDKEVYG